MKSERRNGSLARQGEGASHGKQPKAIDMNTPTRIPPTLALLAAGLGWALALPAGAAQHVTEHCRQMPQMAGCEAFRQSASAASAAVLPGEGLPAKPALPTPIVELEDGDTYRLRAEVVTKTVAGVPLRLYAYNGSVPGPLLKVRQGDKATIEFDNAIDQDTTVHWHGLRVDYRMDGVPGVGQPPVPPVAPGGRYRYELVFPDDGMYWYHPHLREDFQQDAGLYGNLWVLPADPKAYGSVDREVALIVDDVLIDDGRQVPFGRDAADHALMGRFGNVMLVNGDTGYRLGVRAGETVRFYLTNAANTRTFALGFPGVRIKRVGGDGGRYEKESFVDQVTLAPSERAIVEVTFAQAGSFPLVHATPDKRYELGRIEVAAADARPGETALREHRDVQAEIAALVGRFLDAPPSRVLSMRVDRAGGSMDHGGMGHAAMTGGGHGPAPIEWEDEMGAANAASTSADTRWVLRDEAGGAENMDVNWTLKRGEPVKIRLRNPATGTHPMQHPIHFHGQRFVVLTVDGQPVDNRVWKDTVLVPSGSEVDIVLDPTNPGEWMAHCHIAEHLTSGMMIGFRVE